MFRMIRTVIVGIWFAFAIVFFLPWLILWSLLTRTQDLMYWSSMNAVKIGLRIAGVRVHLEGLENIPPGPCILAANHVSYVDPLAFVPFIPRRVSVALKKELYRIPILGPGMLLAKFVSVDRASREGAVDSLKTSVRYSERGTVFRRVSRRHAQPGRPLAALQKRSVRAGDPGRRPDRSGIDQRRTKTHAQGRMGHPPWGRLRPLRPRGGRVAVSHHAARRAAGASPRSRRRRPAPRSAAAR